MTKGLVRYQRCGCFHFVTFSCYRRRPFLVVSNARERFERSLEAMRLRYRFIVAGYVVMPEHVHLLLSEPEEVLLSKAIQAIKLSVSVQSSKRPFWQARYYDFNVHNDEKRIEKLHYMHRNPVVRGLVENPGDWAWSSFRHYASGIAGTVQIESQWTAFRRGNRLPDHLCYQSSQQKFIDPRSQKRDLGHPKLVEGNS
jgi:putative transposase